MKLIIRNIGKTMKTKFEHPDSFVRQGSTDNRQGIVEQKNTLLYITALFFVLSMATWASAQQTVTDIDSNTYNTVKISDRLWMKENLKTTHFRNGESITNEAYIGQLVSNCKSYLLNLCLKKKFLK